MLKENENDDENEPLIKFTNEPKLEKAFPIWLGNKGKCPPIRSFLTNVKVYLTNKMNKEVNGFKYNEWFYGVFGQITYKEAIWAIDASLEVIELIETYKKKEIQFKCDIGMKFSFTQTFPFFKIEGFSDHFLLDGAMTEDNSLNLNLNKNPFLLFFKRNERELASTLIHELLHALSFLIAKNKRHEYFGLSYFKIHIPKDIENIEESDIFLYSLKSLLHQKLIPVDPRANKGVLLVDLAYAIDIGLIHKLGNYVEDYDNPLTEFIPRITEIFILNKKDKSSYFDKLSKLDHDVKLILYKGLGDYIFYLKQNLKNNSVMKEGPNSYMDWLEKIRKTITVKVDIKGENEEYENLKKLKELKKMDEEEMIKFKNEIESKKEKNLKLTPLLIKKQDNNHDNKNGNLNSRLNKSHTKHKHRH